MILALILCVAFLAAGYVGVFDRESTFRQVTHWLLTGKGFEEWRYLPAERCRVCEKKLEVGGSRALAPGVNACHSCGSDVMREVERIWSFDHLKDQPWPPAWAVLPVEAGGAGGSGQIIRILTNCVRCGRLEEEGRCDCYPICSQACRERNHPLVWACGGWGGREMRK